MTTLQIILLAIRIIDALVDYALRQKYISEGQKLEIGRSLAAIADKVGYAKKVQADVAKMDAKELDQALRDLEPKP